MLKPTQAFKPYIASEKVISEFSIKAILLGIVLGVFFAVSNAYLALKVGTTVSASIPAAVMSMGILRLFFKKVTILENNIVQTVGAVGEGLAAGVVFTIPALFLLGNSPSIYHIFLLTVLGGILGILFMIPMRRYIIVQEHGILPFPEGTACAEILKAGEKSNPNAILALWGILIGGLYKICTGVLHLWKESVHFVIRKYEDTVVSMDCTPALLGVGFIIGPRIAAVMFSGGALAWWVLIPMIKIFGQGQVSVFPSSEMISTMSSEEIWSNYIRYIGAGAVTIGGLITLLRIMPVIRKTIVEGFKELLLLFKAKPHLDRVDRDISMSWLILGSIAVILFLWLYPGFHLNIVTILLLVILGFFFVAVTAITVGIVGSTSSPVSGMTITTLLITSLIFLSIGWTERVYLIAAITMSCVANVAICLGNTTSQDLKTGFLVGATPRKQQVAELIGLIFPALAIGGTLYLLQKAYGFGTTALPAPQATLMAIIAKGVIQGTLPLTLVMAGVVLGFVVHLMKTPILPFAIGLYLPLSLSTPIMLGGIVSYFVKKYSRSPDAMDRGILASSGLVAGDACMGVVIAFLGVSGLVSLTKTAYFQDTASLILFCLLAAGLGWYVSRSKRYN